MPDFEQLRDQLRGARSKMEEARQELFQARQMVRKINEEQSQFERSFNPDEQAHLARRRGLEKRLVTAQAEVKALEDVFNRRIGMEKEAFAAFTPFTDPRELVNRLSDEYPFLLLPVRIETRFKTVTGTGGAPRPQLWVRIYPDDCAVDTFEPVLSDAELESARIYWKDVWRAGGIEDQERAAWRGLVASHGSGRAAWIVDQYRPISEKPRKEKKEDIVLVVSSTQPLEEDEEQDVADFWSAVWLADGDARKEDEAHDELDDAVGEDRALEIVERYRPVNLDESPAPPEKKSGVSVRTAFLYLPDPASLATKEQSWSQAPRTEVMPDRFVLIGYREKEKEFELVGRPVPSPLVVGPDPLAAKEDQLRQEDGDLIVSEEMRWMVDFDRAVEAGMGFRVDLTPEQAARGFTRLLALGLRLSADHKQGQSMVEALIKNHQNSRAGFSLLPQGTPTNNTESESSGFSRSDDADASFDDLRQESLFDETSDWFRKRDGQWLAECLGIDPAVLRKVRNAGAKDQCEARAMNVAIWQATMGYWMSAMMQPIFDPEDVEATRWFFNRFVSGRGMIPAVRIGRQPYGILPATAFSRVRWPQSAEMRLVAGLEHPENFRGFIARLHSILNEMDKDWTEMAKNVSLAGKPGDAHQTLLDILGLHPASVEFHQRYSESLQHLYNRLNLAGLGGTFIGALVAANYAGSGMQLLSRLGYAGDDQPDLLEKFFLSGQNLLKGPVVDDRPLSETEKVRAYTPDGRNYLEWLADAARTSMETIRSHQGFTEDRAPTALLFILLRHAMLQGYWQSSLMFHRSSNALTRADAKAAHREPDFIHVREQDKVSESRWQRLYKIDPVVTRDGSATIADFITRNIGRRREAGILQEQVDALDILKDMPTARLERALVEHIDCCSYRWDAWQLGLAHYQLAARRYRQDEESAGAGRGVFIGAYGWLENVVPENKQLAEVRLEGELAEKFKGDAPLFIDSSNQGYIHAPSLNQAVTAAVLRNGFLSNAGRENPQTLAVNLSSERVRVALSVLEGIRSGQSLGALLGYQFERGLHDRHDMAEVDQFIFKMRKVFPLRADRLNQTRTPGDVPIESIEARNVIDGLALAEQMLASDSNRTYPFGKPLPEATAAQKAAIDAEAARLLDIHDAVSDLALAEGVHQAVQGNYDRAAATLDAYSKANFPVEPEVVRTPRTGLTLTHRVALHLKSGLDVDEDDSPRAVAEPAINHWLSKVMPPSDKVACKVVFTDEDDEEPEVKVVTQEDLGLEPIDLLYIMNPELRQEMTELDDRVMRYVYDNFSPRLDSPVEIRYLDRFTDGKISFFELSPQVRALRSLVLRSRPLRATDAALQMEARREQEFECYIEEERIELVRERLDELELELTSNPGGFQKRLEALLADPVANRGEIISKIDDHIAEFTEAVSEAGILGVPQTGWGFAYEWRRQLFGELAQKVRDLIKRWKTRQDEYEAVIDEYEALPPSAGDRQRFDLLQRAERLITTRPAFPLPDDHEDFLDEVEDKREDFDDKLEDFEGLLKDILDNELDGLHEMVEEIGDMLPITEFDSEDFELDETGDRIVAFTSDLLNFIRGLSAELERRLIAVDQEMVAHDAAAQPLARIEALQKAAKIMLGEDFVVVPEFRLAPEQADEWQNALDASAGGSLLRHQEQTLMNDFPVDDWLYGLARVREKMRHWEQTVFLAEGFGRPGPALTPIQLPFKAGDHWLGLEYPADYEIAGERLLYTAHYAAPFQKAKPQCGLLLDEWTEVIPGSEENTGVAFHYDRPNSEPPQVWLLVTPPNFDGAWQWQDLVDALNETLEMARKRAVEPSHVDATSYARFLPATVMAATLYQISISANLALNNKVYESIGK